MEELQSRHRVVRHLLMIAARSHHRVAMHQSRRRVVKRLRMIGVKIHRREGSYSDFLHQTSNLVT